MEKYELEFTEKKATKNTICYTEATEPDQPPVVGTLYVQKWVKPPDKLKVVIEW